MSITCPNCHLKGVVQTQQISSSVRVVCVRCKLPFNVDFRNNLEPVAASPEALVEASASNEEVGVSFEPRALSSMTASPVMSAATAVAKVAKNGEAKALPAADETSDDGEVPYSSPTGFVMENTRALFHETATPADKYGLGLRLMRVSPMWLLLSGLLFISFVVFCNWVTMPNAQAGVQGGGNDARRAINLRPTVNQATNQPVSGAVPMR